MISTEAGLVAEESVWATILWSLWSTKMVSLHNFESWIPFDMSLVFLRHLESGLLSSQPSLPNEMWFIVIYLWRDWVKNFMVGKRRCWPVVHVSNSALLNTLPMPSWWFESWFCILVVRRSFDSSLRQNVFAFYETLYFLSCETILSPSTRRITKASRASWSCSCFSKEQAGSGRLETLKLSS